MTTPAEFPLLPLRDVVVYPHMVIPLFVGRDKSIQALEAAMAGNKQVLLVAQRDASDDVCYSYFLIRRSDDALMGGITLSGIQRGVAQSCSVGYWIGEPYARDGYMTEGLQCVLSHCFSSLGLHRVEAACMPNNDASQALLQRCGFRREGYARKYLKINGAWRDHLLFAVIEQEWY